MDWIFEPKTSLPPMRWRKPTAEEEPFAEIMAQAQAGRWVVTIDHANIPWRLSQADVAELIKQATAPATARGISDER